MTNKNARIAKNTLLLYVRMSFVMLINLYAVRIILNALGNEDYGIYNVVAGVITMLSFMSGVLSSATQRFYSFSIGNKQEDSLKCIFSTSLNIYILLSVIVLIVGETLGLWFINSQLVIPEDRMIAVNWLYQFSIFSFITTILVVPYSAAVVAHEQMGIYAIVSTVECILKLGAALILFIIPLDRLIIYGGALFLVHLLYLIAYAVICRKRYAECHYQKTQNKRLYKELLSFSGWSLFGSLARVGNQQGNTILVNIFFGPLVNASRAVALQIGGAIDVFCNSFIMAVRPAMIKSYAENDYSYLFKLFDFSNKFIYYCLLMICLPLYIEMETVLGLWLKNPTEDMVVFSKLTLVYSLILSLHYPITIIMQATGNVKRYFVPVELFTLLSLPLTYLFYALGYPAVTTFIIMVCVFALAHIVRLIVLKRAISLFSMKSYFVRFMAPAILITGIAAWCTGMVANNIDNTILRLIGVIVASTIMIGIMSICFGLSKSEKELLKKLKKS